MVYIKEGVAESITFEPWSEELIKRLSIIEINNTTLYDNQTPAKNGLRDEKLGITSRKGVCKTCNKTWKDCPGHWGYLDLGVSLYHPGWADIIYKTLKMYCLSCFTPINKTYKSKECKNCGTTYPVINKNDTWYISINKKPMMASQTLEILKNIKKNHPDRFFQVGIAEANMMGIAAGLTIGGKIPFTGTFANFSTGRVYDQIRQSIAYSGKNVKICASHAGVTLGEDGATHQILEDIGLMKMLPGMTVINTCDYNQTKAATIAIADYNGPVYLRFGRPKVPNFTDENQSFNVGEGLVLSPGKDVSIIATGHLVWEALEAAKALHDQGISAEIIDIHTIKPLDEKLVIESAKKTGAVVSCEEHNFLGGLGESISRTLAMHHPTPQEFVATKDTFGESGTPAQLMDKYGLNANAIVSAANRVLARKIKELRIRI